MESFWKRVDVRGETECWLWAAGKSKGYGVLKWNGKSSWAHRVAYELTNGPIPPGMCVCHTCDVPSCVNPRHLWLGTKADNNRDKTEKGRAVGYSLPGSTNPVAKLREGDVRYIRKCLEERTLTPAQLAKRFCVSTTLIYRIRDRIAWYHI